MTRLAIAIPLIVFSTTGCFIGSYQGEIPEDPVTVKQKMTHVIEDLDWSYDSPAGDAEVSAYLDFGWLGKLRLKSATIFDADLVVFHEDDFLNTERKGAIRLKPCPGGTSYEGTFASDADDPHADAHLILQLTRQRIRLDAGTMEPCENTRKSSRAYIALNVISPLISARYLARDNPYLSSRLRGTYYWQSAIGDLLMGSLLLGSLLTENDDTRNRRIRLGITTGVLWRLLTLLNLADLNRYNRLARYDYDLKRAVLNE